MDNLSIAAVAGLRSRMQSLDLLANNLANSATSGFKRDAEYYGLYSGDEASEGGTSVPNISKQWTDFSQGSLEVTGNAMDMAISGDGFFVLKGPGGPLYTRNGNLQVLSTGELATSEGLPLVDKSGAPIKVGSGKPIEIHPDGEVIQNGQPIGRLQVAQFKNVRTLSKLSGTCFKNNDPKNLPTDATGVQVLQGKVEGSNVPVAEAAMRLVGVMRQFEMLQKAVGISNEMDTKTIQEVARVGS